MKPARPSAYQKKLDAILEQYRDKEPRPAADRQHLGRLWREFVFPMRWQLLFAIILALASSLQPFIWAKMVQLVVDVILCVGRTIPPMEMPLHYRWVVYLFLANCAIHISAVIISWQYSYHITLIGQKITFALRKMLHERLQALPLSFFDRTQTGRLLSIVLDDVSTIQNSIGSLAVNLVNNLAIIVVGAVIICVLNWKLAILVFIALPFYVMNFRHFRPRIREGNIAARRATTALYNKVEERVTAVRTIKVFGRERSEVRTFAEAANNMARLTMHIVRMSSWQNIIATAITALVTGCVLYQAMLAVKSGGMDLGKAMQLFISISFLFNPAVALNDLIGMEIPRVSVVLRRVFDLMDADPEPVDAPEAVVLREARGDIAFKNVTFTYPGDERATLHDVAFEVPAGKQVAIMGPSGAGKSSLLYLLMRFYDPEAGSISLDGHDLPQIKLLSLRDRITLVMQEPVIFSGTVAENIRYGHLDASDAEVRRAAKDADLHEFVMSLPDSYETVVGERGMSLSGGQRQRLALAASLLSGPSVLLLDDTTSALDPVTEAKVQKTLDRLMQNRTCFVVTHRISTALASDLVLVLEDGRVTQFDTPAKLQTEEGLFRRVYEQQLRQSADATAAQ
ncbi:MAG: ABC transporter ATP-binding protein [Armatimonadota bacterium]